MNQKQKEKLIDQLIALQAAAAKRADLPDFSLELLIRNYTNQLIAVQGIKLDDPD